MTLSRGLAGVEVREALARAFIPPLSIARNNHTGGWGLLALLIKLEPGACSTQNRSLSMSQSSAAAALDAHVHEIVS